MNALLVLWDGALSSILDNKIQRLTEITLEVKAQGCRQNDMELTAYCCYVSGLVSKKAYVGLMLWLLVTYEIKLF